jgi:hypothetical protein
MEYSVKLLVAKCLLDNLVINDDLLEELLLLRNSVLVSDDAADRAYSAFKVADTRLHRVVLNEFLNLFVIKMDQFVCYAIIINLSWNQVLLSYL